MEIIYKWARYLGNVSFCQKGKDFLFQNVNLNLIFIPLCLPDLLLFSLWFLFPFFMREAISPRITLFLRTHVQVTIFCLRVCVLNFSHIKKKVSEAFIPIPRMFSVTKLLKKKKKSFSQSWAQKNKTDFPFRDNIYFNHKN